MVITVYKMDASPSVRTVLMTVELLGLEIETKDINTLNNEQFAPEYLEKNPTHTIPLIEDGHFILADSHAIITYLVSKYGAERRATLYPEDLKTKATIDHRLYVDATLVFPNVRKLVISIIKEKAPGPTTEQIAAALEAYGYLEKYLEKTSFLAADHLTVADIAAVATISSLDVFVPIESEKFPKITKWWEKIQGEDWYQKASARGLRQFDRFLKHTMQQNANN